MASASGPESQGKRRKKMLVALQGQIPAFPN